MLPVHCDPLLQAGPVPHMHAPFVHALDVCASHAAHAAPPVPHEPVDSEPYGSHVPFAVQQPLGHEVASHTHWPVVVLHCWPIAQAWHAAPPAPHDVSDSDERGSHVPPAVQQPAHVPPPQLQLPFEHVCPFVHAVQAAPAVPQDAPDCAA